MCFSFHTDEFLFITTATHTCSTTIVLLVHVMSSVTSANMYYQCHKKMRRSRSIYNRGVFLFVFFVCFPRLLYFHFPGYSPFPQLWKINTPSVKKQNPQKLCYLYFNRLTLWEKKRKEKKSGKTGVYVLKLELKTIGTVLISVTIYIGLF